MLPKAKAILAIIILLYLSASVVKQYLAHRYYPTEISSLWEGIEKGKQGDELIPLLEEAIKLAPSNAEYYYQLAKLYMKKVRKPSIWQDKEQRESLLSKAIENAQRAISLNPAASQHYIALAWAYSLEKPASFHQGSANSFNKAISLNPSAASVNYHAGYYYLHKWRVLSPVDKKRAISILQRTINLSDRYSNMIFDKAWQEMRGYDALKQIISDTPESHIRLADYLKKIGMLMESTQEYKKAIALKPTNPRYYHALAQLYHQKKEYRKAIAKWKKMLSLDTKSIAAHLGLGYAYSQLEMWEESMREYSAVLKLQPDHLEAKENLEKIKGKTVAG